MKPENMKSVTRTRTSSDQKNSGLGFDGLDNGSSPGPDRNRFAGNQHGGAAEGNFGCGPRVGNNGTSREGPKKPPTSAVPDFKSAAKRAFEGKFNAGPQRREYDGTRPWAPSATENYRGDIDRINEGRGPTKGNQQ
jgi:hypothetical protein